MNYQYKELYGHHTGEGHPTPRMFPLLAWFLNDFIGIREKLRLLSVKRKRSNTRKIRKYNAAFTGEDMALDIIAIILSGISSFEKIDEKLHPERKLAEILGLKRFFDKTYARKFLGEFSLFHIRQIETINTRILQEFGECFNQRIGILDIDLAARTLKRASSLKQTQHRYIWGICSSKEEIIAQKLGQGEADSYEHFVGLIEEARARLNLRRMIMRVNGEYMEGSHLTYCVKKGFYIMTRVSWDTFFRSNADLDTQSLPWVVLSNEESDETDATGIMHIKLCDIGERIAMKGCRHRFRSVLVEIIKGDMALKKRGRHRRYVIIHNIPGLEGERASYEFYRQRQTMRNIFKGGKNPFTHGKMPSGKFRANEAYLNFVILAYNLFTIFKKNACPIHERNNLLRLLEI